MEPGQNGIIVTTNRIEENARKEAKSDVEKPVDFIDVSDFAQLVFDKLSELNDQEMWSLGLRRLISGR